jgi:glucose-6-phosphate isomerase
MLPVFVGHNPLSITYGSGVSGPQPEYRSLDAIRRSLRDPSCSGPDPVYAIAMDVAKDEHRELLERNMLLFGVVAYARGKLGEEPVRSQGHVHAVAAGSGLSTPELIEVWSGRALVYLQQWVRDHPGRCVVIEAKAGDQVVIPPGWAHYIVNANADSCMTFGAWCTRQYAFCYDEIRAHRGLAWFPLLQRDGAVSWEPNKTYHFSKLIQSDVRSHPELGLLASVPIYLQCICNPERFQWIPRPETCQEVWDSFISD